MTRQRQHVDQVGDLWIGPVRRGIDDDCDITLRKSAPHTLHDSEGGIGSVLNAKDYLKIRMSLTAAGSQGLFQHRFIATKRSQNSYRGMPLQLRLCWRGEATDSDQSGETKQHARTGEQRGRSGKPGHCIPLPRHSSLPAREVPSRIDQVTLLRREHFITKPPLSP